MKKLNFLIKFFSLCVVAVVEKILQVCLSVEMKQQ